MPVKRRSTAHKEALRAGVRFARAGRQEGSAASFVLTKATNRLSFNAEDCRGQLTAEGRTAIESFRKDVSTRAILDARVDAWRKQLRTTNQERKFSNVSR